jgi:DnaJ-domain-containing protein 1
VRADSTTRSESLGRGDFARLAYRLGRNLATGVLTVDVPRVRPEVLVLRRGHLITTELDALGRLAAARLARLAAVDGAAWSFDGGTAAHPPGTSHRQLALARWSRQHLENQLDAARADRLVSELAGVRISVRAEHVPDATLCDDTDQRILAAMAQPRRLDQIWPLARTPRFRLLAFIHFLRSVGALSLVGVAAADIGRPGDPRSSALRLLGLAADAERDDVKRAYRRMARALHPDLQPGVDGDRRRDLESRLAEVTAAYQQLVAQLPVP